MAAVDDVTDLDNRHEAIPHLASTEWVESYEPNLSSAGYNLVFYRRRIPMLMDMQGRVVHSWPGVRGVGRARLDTEGRLVVIGIDDMIKEYDWEGNLTWAYRFPNPDDLPHHDLIKLANGNYLVLARGVMPKTEYLHEVDRDGRVVWRWLSVEHLNKHFPDRNLDVGDSVHFNSLFELPENRWFDAGDTRFKPGNLLVSARNLSRIFIIDKQTGDVVWIYGENLDNQHEAQIVPKGQWGEGLIVLFNNGFQNLGAYRRSDIRAINPIDNDVLWVYSTPTFFSSIAGTQQILPSGNLLITSSEGGRAFEITPDKQIVWEWIPPYFPMRVHRYPADHCPQLAALGPLDSSPVVREDRQPWVDLELGRYAISNEFRAKILYGKRRQVLSEPEGCREAFLPNDPEMQVAYGFDRDKLDGTLLTAGFKVSIRDLDGGDIRILVDDTLDSTEETLYRDRRIELTGLDSQRVEICVDVWSEKSNEEDGLHRSVFLTNPTTSSRKRAQLTGKWKKERRSLREQTLEERQLRALGYVQ
jgi:hypothetical protein